jgi:hypothetical protein
VADPFAVLGVPPGASPGEVAARYRALAKRWHPDRAPGVEAERRMARINAAYDELRGRGAVAAAPPAPAPTARPAAPRRPPGWWLPDATRTALGPELLAALHPRERVDRVVETATWAGSAVLAVTERRLLWLHDDAVTGRVRALRWLDVAGADVRRGWPRRGTATVRVRRTGGRRPVAFGELPVAEAEALARLVAGRVIRRPAG